MPRRSSRLSGGASSLSTTTSSTTSNSMEISNDVEIVAEIKAKPAERRNKRKSRSGRSALGSVDANTIAEGGASRAKKRTKRTKSVTRKSSKSSSSSSSDSTAVPNAPSTLVEDLPVPKVKANKKSASSRRSSRSASKKKAKTSSTSSSSSSTSSSVVAAAASSSSSSSSTSLKRKSKSSADKKISAAKANVNKTSVRRAVHRLEADVNGINHGSTVATIIEEIGGKRKMSRSQCTRALAELIANAELFVDTKGNNFFSTANDLKVHECVTDIDEGHKKDPRYVTNYVTDIMKFRRNLEATSRPGIRFLDDFQTDITPNMRSILVDWLVEVAEEYHLHTESLYTAVNYVDRCLERSQIHRHKLQLLGCACMLLASKFEEIYAPAVDEFVYISDNTYTHEEIVRMESKVCKILNFKMTVSTTTSFLTRFIQAAECDQALLSDSSGTEEDKEKAPYFAKYLSELALQEYNMLKYKPSMVAAASVSLSRRTCNIKPVWHPTLTHYTRYEHVQLRQCERALRRLQRQAGGSELRAIYEKYQSSSVKRVSMVSCKLFWKKNIFSFLNFFVESV